MAHGIPQLEARDWQFKQNVQIDGVVSRSPGRYYLEEFFIKEPAINADIQNAAEATRMIANTDFEVLGTNGVTASTAFSSTLAGVTLTTAGADDDQVIILPHLDTKQTAWTNIKWGTENQVVWECSLTVGDDITNGVLLWAGLKLTNTPTIITDNDQVYFRFDTDDSNTTWRIISSIGGTDTNTNSGVTVAVNTNYRFRIAIDSDRKATCYINGVALYKTAALTNDVDLIPYVGIQARNGAAEFCTLHYEKISRILFE